MKKMGLNDIRESYIKFFEEKGHYVLPSAPVVPKNDKSLLLINAGMAPLKPYFTGLQTPPSKRVTNCQKCIRTGDIESVGKTSRHATFFEMLGNFSFGDYFKEEIIPWAWEYITEVLEIPKDKLYVTVYEGDDEAKEIWLAKTDVPAERIFKLGKKDNFWEHGVGPCGPCTEIHFDRGEGLVTSREEFERESDNDRIVEFWNLVFTQYNREEDGTYSDLENPNIDTGMGLERMATILQGVNSIFEVDTIKRVLDKVSEISGKEFKEGTPEATSLKIVADHARSVTIMIGDGVLPSNEGRGYVLRRLLRRAARHGKGLGIDGVFLGQIIDVILDTFKDTYPELIEKEAYIKKIVKLEEERFAETIDSGIAILNEYIEELKGEGKKTLSGDKAFKLYDTYGFPYELTEEVCEEEGVSIDREDFEKELTAQKERARAARGEDTYMGSDVSALDNLPKDIVTSFMGYEYLEYNSEILAIIRDDERVGEISSGDKAFVVIKDTPFYAEKGGQIGDTGIITAKGFKAKVVDTKTNIADNTVHTVEVLEGTITEGAEVKLEIETARRNNICKNHTATHMVHEALRTVLGEHVHQSGSYVDENRLRFDFTHFEGMTSDELKKVEDLVNNEIMNSLEVETKELTMEEAKEAGATALFDEKYGDKVRVVSVGDFSIELCGGTHVKNTGEIGIFKIVSENGVASGVRRIEAITGKKALEYLEEKSEILRNVSELVKSNEKDVITRIEGLLADLKVKDKQISQMKKELSKGIEDELIGAVQEISGVKVLAAAIDEMDGNSLRELAEKLRDKIGSVVVVLGSEGQDKAMFVAMASKDLLAKNIHCGKIIKEVASIAGGGGGGRPDMAQAGGKKPEMTKEAINAVASIIEKMV